LWTFLYVEAYVWFQLFWIRVNRMLSQPTWVTRPATDTFHKIVVIGDGFAEGLGDFVVLGSIAGVTRRLRALIKGDVSIKQQWLVLNAGTNGTASCDWVPDAPLFKNTFSQAAYNDAEIVLLWVGANDGRPGPKHQAPSGTVENIKAICDALRKQGKRVIVAGLPCTGAAKYIEEEEEWNKEANRLLRVYIEEAKNDELSSSTPLACSPMLDGPKFNREFSLGFDEVHFNSEGYKIAAKDVYEVLHNYMKAIEWEVFKNKLGCGPPSSANDTKKDK